MKNEPGDEYILTFLMHSRINIPSTITIVHADM